LEKLLGIIECGVVHHWETYRNTYHLEQDRVMFARWSYLLMADKIHWKMWEVDHKDMLVERGEEEDAADRMIKKIVEGKRKRCKSPVWLRFMNGEMDLEELKKIENDEEEERIAKEEEKRKKWEEERLRREEEEDVEMTDLEDLDDLDDLEEGEIRE